MQLLWVMKVRLAVMRWPVVLEGILVGKRMLVRIHDSSGGSEESRESENVRWEDRGGEVNGTRPIEALDGRRRTGADSRLRPVHADA